MGYTPTSSSESAGESQKTRLLYFSNEFPHDDLQQLFRRLHVHSKDNRHAILAQFIDKATSAIREEVRHLPAVTRNMFPPFQTVFDLADDAELRRGPMCGSIDGVLLCAVQLATFIGYHESQNRWDPQSRDTCLAGLGTGLLATAAVSLSPTLADIPLAGAEVVRIAFRLGVVVAEVSQNLQSRPLTDTGPPETWAYVVPDVATNDVQKELDAIHTREKTPNASKVFISAHSRTSVTISGPPSRLQGIFRLSEYFRDRKCVALPVFGGLCHAGHIYSEKHVSSIVQGSSLDFLQAELSVGIPVFSTSRGRPFPAKTASGLFESIIGEILTQPIQWDNVIRSIVERADSMAVSECQVLVFRTSLPIYDLVATLNSELQPFASTVVDLVSWIAEPTTGQAEPRGTAQSKIAIVGMSCRMPGGAIDTEKFWQLLEEGLDVTRKIPADRFDVETHYDAAGKRVNASHTPYGCFIDEPGLFDAPFFNMSPREAQQTDPMQRLALVTAYEALERAGYVANRTRSTNLHRIGTFYGQASDDYREVNTAQEISTYFIPGGCRAFGPGRINYFFKFSGPSFSCDTACSSSLATIQAACTSLWNGDTDMVVAGGMNVLTNSDAFAGLSHGHFLSKTPGACKTWDCDADGYCRADGIGSIVLKRLEDAEADNDNILGVVLGAATNHSAEAISITHPHAGAQSYLYTHVMNMAGLNPVDVNFVEMHGTGTQAGDTVEIKSISDVFAPLTPSKRRSAKQPLYIGAVKSNVGHGEAAAGVTALLKVLLMLQKQAIPKHVGIKNSINTAFPKDLDRRNMHIPYQMTPWPRVAEKKRIAVVNNFSAAGGNTTLAIEEAPLREVAATDPRSIHVIALSAKSKASLKGNIERLVAYLDANPDVSLSNLSYTTTARRHHHNHRVAIPTSDAAQLRKQLVSHLQSVDAHKIIPTTGPPPVVFAFTGQGASRRSMNLQLFHDSPYFRSQLCDLNTLAERQGFPSFIPAIDGTCPQDHAHSPVVTQLALVCTEIALAKYWGSLGVRPDVVVGHSLGEYAALHMAGVLSTSDAIFLVGQRANMLQTRCQAGSHKMLAVRASLPQIKESAGDKPYEVACINGPKDTVLSGTLGEIDALSETLGAAGYKCFGLDIDFAFHSAQTDPILEQFEDIARTGAVFHPPILPVISPLLGKVVFDDKTINSSYVRRATREPVNFLSALEMAHGIQTIDETMVWVEVGPHPVCMGFVKTTLPSLNLAVASLRRDEDNWQTLAASLSALHCAGVAVDWGEFHRPFERVLRLLDLPTYAWNDKNYWIQYNGNWALTKGNTFYDADASIKPPGLVQHSGLMTSTMQRVVEESFDGSAGRVVVWSDLMEPDFYAAASGHKMNGCSVVTSSIHADIAFTLGEYLWKKLNPNAKAVPVIDICNLEVTKGLVAQKKAKTPQLIQVSATTRDIHGDGTVHLEWHNVLPNGAVADDPFASTTIKYGVATAWLASWIPAAHLVQGRIDALERLAEQGVANRMSHNMAYSLFAGSLVDYAPKYRGMQAVVLHGLEACADVTLSTEQGGTWTIPPHFIDSVAHLAGFVMNVSDALDIRTNFCVTPGWGSMRFARPLVAGGRYRSYVKMIPTAEDPGVYLGDVYVLQGGEIVGLVAGIKFRRYPRLLLGRFFSAPDESGVVNHAPAAVASSAKPSVAPSLSQAGLKPDDIPQPVVLTEPHSSKVATSASRAPTVEPGPNTALTTDSDSTAAKAIALIAAEAALELEDLHDVTSFAEVGVDSLMSLVIAEKLREELGVIVSGSLFLEYPTVGDLRSWLVEYYN